MNENSKSNIMKILTVAVSVLSFSIIVFISFIMFILVVFKANKIYVYMFAFIIVLFLSNLLLFYFKKSSKVFVLGFIFISILSGTIMFSFSKYNDYIKNIPVLSEQDFSLSEYIPYNDSTKISKLENESQVKIDGNIPVMDGATALYPLYASFVEAIYPKGDYSDINENKVMCNGTTVAYSNLINKKADIIFVASPSKEQKEEAKKQNITMYFTPIGKEAFVFFVNKKNNVTNLTTEEIRGIYSGKITNWKYLGGKNQEIIAYQRPNGSGSQTMLEKIMDNMPLKESPKSEIASGMGRIIINVANYKNFKNAIGYSFLFFTTRMVKNNDINLLSIDKVYPSRETIINDTYPFTGYFYAVTTSTNNKNVEKIIDFTLSEEGQYLIEKIGYTPLN